MKNKSNSLIFFIYLFIPISVICSGNEELQKQSFWSYKGFSGGMQVHTGILHSHSFLFEEIGIIQQISGYATGLGGRAGFHFGDFFRFGAEGYSSSVWYKNQSSLFRVGWGGVTAEFLFPAFYRFKPYTGIMLGGGKYQNVISIEEQEKGNTAFFRNQRFMAFAAFAGIEFNFTQKLSFVLKSDYTFNVQSKSDFAEGFRFYFGLIFNTLYKRDH